MDDKSISLCGRVADTLLGERLNGIQEVSGSIPLISTKTWNLRISGLFLYFLVKVFLWTKQKRRESSGSLRFESI